ncbi:MAG: NUDIX domain-containing protein [Saprospiraceae bacterium]
MPFENSYFNSAFSVDNVIFGLDDLKLKVLLIQRNSEPFKGRWALPGALVNPDENLRDSPKRVLEELTGLREVYLEQVHTFGKVDRHPKGRVVTVAYYSLVNIHKVKPKAASFASKVEWFDVFNISDLAFDHFEILNKCIKRLQDTVRIMPIGFELLPEKFTLSDVQSLYEAVLHKRLDKRNFRKKFLAMGILVDVNEYQKGVAHRPAKLFKFETKKYLEFKGKGFNFEV